MHKCHLEQMTETDAAAANWHTTEKKEYGCDCVQQQIMRKIQKTVSMLEGTKKSLEDTRKNKDGKRKEKAKKHKQT